MMGVGGAGVGRKKPSEAYKIVRSWPGRAVVSSSLLRSEMDIILTHRKETVTRLCTD